jgi:6,7-dimethyl-8-ribityllumazine synthase
MENEHVIEGKIQADNLKFAIVCSRFNDFFVSKLLEAAVASIIRHNGNRSNVTIVWVPGCFEIPLVTQTLAAIGKYDAIIALGVIIKGATSHADYINAQVTSGLAEVSLKTSVPVTLGVISADNQDQAIERSGSKAGNRGSAAAEAAIEMANLMKELK